MINQKSGIFLFPNPVFPFKSYSLISIFLIAKFLNSSSLRIFSPSFSSSSNSSPKTLSKGRNNSTENIRKFSIAFSHFCLISQLIQLVTVQLFLKIFLQRVSYQHKYLYFLHDPKVVHQDEIDSFLNDSQESHEVALADTLTLGVGLVALERIEEGFNPLSKIADSRTSLLVIILKLP